VTATDRLRVLIATWPTEPTSAEIAHWFETGGELVRQHFEDLKETASAVIELSAECARRGRAINAAGAAARTLSALVCELGAYVDDGDPRVMATAGPIGQAQAELWTALGLDFDAERARMHEDIASRCAVCGRTLTETIGCVRGSCSMRPRPERLFAPARAAKEADRTFDVSDLDDADITTAPPRATPGVLSMRAGERDVAVPVSEDDENGSIARRAAAALNGEPGPW
jgi:hypothetical protein